MVDKAWNRAVRRMGKRTEACAAEHVTLGTTLAAVVTTLGVNVAHVVVTVVTVVSMVVLMVTVLALLLLVRAGARVRFR